jgi:hypothetical protein
MVNAHIERTMQSSRMLRHVALVRTDISEEVIASVFRVNRMPVLKTATRRDIPEDCIFIAIAVKFQILHSINRLGSVAET